MLEQVYTGLNVIDKVTGAVEKIVGTCINSILVSQSAPIEKGIRCNKWFLIPEFEKRFEF